MAKKLSSNAPATSYQIAKDLFLVRQPVTGKPTTAVAAKINHVVVLDVSGSMSGDLPQLREQLKKKITKLLKEGDTLSMIWFSGRGQFGTLFEAEPVATLADLKDVHTAIDRWLRPIGMTGFKEPLEEVAALMGRVGKKNDNPFSMFFMSDGCDNQWARADVLATVGKLAGKLASATFVEYGYYADRQLLAQMAEKSGGSLIFADAFDKYEPAFEAALAKPLLAGKRIELPVGDTIGGFAYALDDGEITTFEAGAGKVSIPEATAALFYLSPVGIGTTETPLWASGEFRIDKEQAWLSPTYAALSLFGVRAKPEIVWPILKALGDVAFIEQFGKCFGKQKYSDFMTFTKLAAFSTAHRFVRGYNPNAVPDDNAFTVIELLRILSMDESTRLLLDDPSFTYSRISRKREDTDDLFSDVEQEKLDALQARMAAEKSATKVRALQTELAALLANKQEPLKFVADPAPDGYPINGLVYNESRANISMRVLKPGTVDLSKRTTKMGNGVKFTTMDPAPTGSIPVQFKTQIWRNYTLIKDGLVNIEQLPMIISRSMYNTLLQNRVPMRLIVGRMIDGVERLTVQIDVAPLPIINRKMVKHVGAVELATLQYDLTRAKAEQKVFNHYVKEKYGDSVRLASFTELYGEDGAAWLKEQGITPSGFAPAHTTQAEATDVYMGRELNVKIAGFGDLPSVNEITKRVANPKSKPLAGSAKLIGSAMLDAEAFLKGPAATHQKWLTGKQAVATATARSLMHRIAEIKYAILVGNAWFSEFKSIDENELTVKLGGTDCAVTFEAREIEIPI